MTEGQFTDYYEVLQVSPRADGDTIERVFRHLAKRYHPDNRESGNADRFTEVMDAYRVLSDNAERARYDVKYERFREERWRIFGQDRAMDEVATDSRLRLAVMSILYVARRDDPREPGLGAVELERLLGCPEPVISFHLWYMRESGWVERLTSGHIAITAAGVDRLFEIGGPAKTGPQLLKRGEDLEKEA